MTRYYDVLSAWPIIGSGPHHLAWQKAELAMAVRGKYAHWKLKDIRPRHWDGMARAAGLRDADASINEVSIQVPSVLAQASATLPKNFPRRICDKIFAGIERQTKVLAAG